MSDETKLSVVERRTLKKHTKTIDQGLATFAEVGTALREIRDGKLYKEESLTFEKFVAKRWEMSRSTAYERIETSDVFLEMSEISDKTKPSNQEQCKALLKVSSANRAEVWESVLRYCEEQEIEPTGKLIKQTAKELGHLKEVEKTEKEQREFDQCMSCDGTGKLFKDDGSGEVVDGKVLEPGQVMPSDQKSEMVQQLYKKAQQEIGRFRRTAFMIRKVTHDGIFAEDNYDNAQDEITIKLGEVMDLVRADAGVQV